MACRPIAAPMQARMVVTERRPKRDGGAGDRRPQALWRTERRWMMCADDQKRFFRE